MNKDKRNNIQLLGTLNNADESGIIANANQIYDANEDKSTQDVTEEHTERIKTLEDKENSMQATLENISKTGEASAASNVTYNHSDSKLDATNVQQAIDEVRRRSNYNDGDNIIDFNTIHLITDNPEYISVILDASQKILEAYGVDGIKRLFTAIELMGTKMSTEDNPEFIKVDVDKGNKILGGFKANGDYIFGAGVPTQIQVKAKEIADNLDTANAVDLDSDIDGSIYASIGKDGNIDVTSDDEGVIYMVYDTDKLDIKDTYEDMDGNLIVEQNKVMIL